MQITLASFLCGRVLVCALNASWRVSSIKKKKKKKLHARPVRILQFLDTSYIIIIMHYSILPHVRHYGMLIIPNLSNPPTFFHSCLTTPLTIATLAHTSRLPSRLPLLLCGIFGIEMQVHVGQINTSDSSVNSAWQCIFKWKSIY